MKDDHVLGFYNDAQREPQGDYYCGNGSQNAIGRDCVEAAFKRCILGGVHVTGMNAEVAPSQWEIQVCATGINAADPTYYYALRSESHSRNVWSLGELSSQTASGW